MNLQQAITAVTDRHDLKREQMNSVMRLIMRGEATEAQIGGLLIGLRMKGETVDEITAAAEVMREFADPVYIKNPKHLIDIVGTGGDKSNTFNISTAACFIAAAAGAQVAKHGNRAVSSQSGSADVLKAAGLVLDLSPEQVGHCIEKTGMGFMFAPKHHRAMKYAIGPRREMGVRTIFNILGPLSNPARVKNLLLGTFSKALLNPLAHVCKALGQNHVMVVHSDDGLDEISIAANTQVAELKNNHIQNWTINPADYHCQTNNLDAIQANSPEQSLKLINETLSGQTGPAADIVALNAGAAIYISGLVDSFSAGVSQAREVIESTRATEKMTHLVELTHRLSGRA